MTKMMIVGDQAFKFNIWDTAGQERVSSFKLESAEYLLFLTRICFKNKIVIQLYAFHLFDAV